MKTTIQSTILIVAIILIASESVLPQAAYPSARTGHSMVAIDTLIYVFGGESVESTNQKAVLLNNLSKYDVKKSEWQEELPVNEPPTGRKKHSSTTYNGKIIISFGETQTGYSNEIWEYSPTTKMWEQITSPVTIFPLGPTMPQYKLMNCCMLLVVTMILSFFMMHTE